MEANDRARRILVEPLAPNQSAFLPLSVVPLTGDTRVACQLHILHAIGSTKQGDTMTAWQASGVRGPRTFRNTWNRTRMEAADVGGKTKRHWRMGMAALLLAGACGDGDSLADIPREGPDLIISAPDAPGRVAHGHGFLLGVTLLNQGTRTAGRTQIRFLHSSDRTITPDDAVVGSQFTDTMAVGDEYSTGIGVEPPYGEFGTLYYGACVDPLPDEIDPNNNCSSAVGVEIYLPPPFGSVVDRTDESLTSDIVGSGQASYQIYRSYTERGDYDLAVDVPASSRVTRYVDGGLEPNTVYYYKAIACNGPVCSAESGEWGGLTEVAGPVDVPAVPDIRGEKVNVPFGTDKARVHWDAVPWATYYRVYHDNDLDAEVSAPATSYFDDDPNTFLGAYQTTTYRVKACNKAGCSDFSDTVVIHLSAASTSRHVEPLSGGGGRVPGTDGRHLMPARATAGAAAVVHVAAYGLVLQVALGQVHFWRQPMRRCPP